MLRLVAHLLASVALAIGAWVLVAFIALLVGEISLEPGGNGNFPYWLVASLLTFIGYWVLLIARTVKTSPPAPPVEKSPESPHDGDSSINRTHQH